jgi:hypothetical protein
MVTSCRAWLCATVRELQRSCEGSLKLGFTSISVRSENSSVYYKESIHQHVLQLERRWTDAELRGDVDALAELLDQDFRFVGPNGSLIDRERYLNARNARELTHNSFVWADVGVSVYSGAAVAIGRLTQRSTHRGRDISGDFRATQVVVQQGHYWKIACLHLSRIDG